MTPPITREARDWLCLRIRREEPDTTADRIIDLLHQLPLTPADPLDAVRARWQPKTRGGYEYEIFAERHGWLYGRYHDERGKPWPGKWAEKSGRMAEYIDRDSHPYHLVLVSPHSALIAELREQAENHDWFHQMRGLFKRAADALEKQP